LFSHRAGNFADNFCKLFVVAWLGYAELLANRAETYRIVAIIITVMDGGPANSMIVLVKHVTLSHVARDVMIFAVRPADAKFWTQSSQ
jgi:hypothetical protein